MKKFSFQTLSRSCLAFLSAASLWTIPNPVVAQSCCQEDDCCRGGGWWSNGNGRTALIIGGAAVVGGVAGAIAGNASAGGKGHSGSRGPRGFTGDPGATGPAGPFVVGPTGATGATGATGPSPFTADTDETLTFTVDLIVPGPIVLGSALTITPFVTAPDGTTTEGTPVTFPAGLPGIAAGTLSFPIPTINDPLFGTYHVGLNFNPAGGLVGLGVTLEATAFASRDGSTTALGEPSFVLAVDPGATQAQRIREFTYDPNNVP